MIHTPFKNINVTLIGLIALCGVLFFFSFVYESTWWLFLVAFPLFFWILKQLASVKKAFLVSWLIGTCKYAGALIWFWSIYPLDWLGLTGVTQLFLIGIYWLVIIIVIGLSFGLFSLLIFCKKFTWYLMVFLIITTEILGSLLFSLVTIGEGSLPSFNLSYGYLGYLLVDIQHLQNIALLGGVYSLSLTAALLSVLFFFVFEKKYQTSLICALCILSLLCVGAYERKEVVFKTLEENIMTIDTRFDTFDLQNSAGFRKKKDETLDAVYTALKFDVNTIILPEDSRFIDIFLNEDEVLDFLTVDREKPIRLFDSGRTKNKLNETVLRGYIFDSKQNTVFTIDKQYLVPQGEYVSYIVDFLLRLLLGADNQWYVQIKNDMSYRPGSKQISMQSNTSLPVILFCMESNNPYATKKLIIDTPDAPYIVHPFSHGKINNSYIFTFTIDRMLITQSIWNKIPIVSAGNMAPGKIYLPTGVVSNGETVLRTSFWDLKIHTPDP
ncbi:MAG: apolipoprotein N-acyltransferase [Acidimicrobiales bacterium]|jgi:apolipoprotein N-acyltransferase